MNLSGYFCSANVIIIFVRIEFGLSSLIYSESRPILKLSNVFLRTQAEASVPKSQISYSNSVIVYSQSSTTVPHCVIIAAHYTYQLRMND